MRFFSKTNLRLRLYYRVYLYPFYLKTKLLFTSFMQFGRWKPAPKLSAVTFESGTQKNAEVHSVYGGAVICQNNKLLSGTCSFPWGEALHPARTTLFFNLKSRTIEKAIYLVTPEAEGNFYHWLIDSFGRLGLVTELDQVRTNFKKVILHGTCQKYEDDCLQKVGFNSEDFIRLNSKERAYVHELFIPPKRKPQDLSRVVNFLRLTYLDVIGSHAPPNSHPKIIWVSRSRARKRKLVNEDAVLHKLSCEFEIESVEMEAMSLGAQIKLASSADILLGIHGAAFSLCAFMSPGSSLIEIMNPHCRQDFYSDLCAVANVRYDMVSAGIHSLNFSQSQIQDLRWGNEMDLILDECAIKKIIKKVKTLIK